MKLYIYDHCPYCVKARIIFGLKNINFELITLLNDDEKTPISMIGKKMLPILEKDNGSFMCESLDIINYIDAGFGLKKAMVKQENQEILKWLLGCSDYLYKLCMPRWAKSDLEEFKSNEAIDYFARKKELYIGSFLQNLANSEALIKIANEHLQKLDKILQGHTYSEEELSYSDIHLFTNLRSLSIVKGLKYGNNIKDYRQEMSRLSKMPLHDEIAI